MDDDPADAAAVYRGDLTAVAIYQLVSMSPCAPTTLGRSWPRDYGTPRMNDAEPTFFYYGRRHMDCVIRPTGDTRSPCAGMAGASALEYATPALAPLPASTQGSLHPGGRTHFIGSGGPPRAHA